MVTKAPLPKRVPATMDGLPRGYHYQSILTFLQEVSVLYKFSIRGSIRGEEKIPT